MGTSAIRATNARGSMTLLLAVFIVPVFFLILSVSLDVAAFLSELQRAQKIVDDTALYAFRFMPYQESARAAACSFVSQQASGEAPLICGENVSVAIPVDGSTVTITLRRGHPLTLARYFGVEMELPIEASAAARGRPFDTFLILDLSRYLAPVADDGSAPWGEPSLWPAAQFTSLHPLGTIDGRLLTQQCVNPVLAPLKRSAIYTYEYLAMNGLNAVGVGFAPGASNFVDIARQVLPRGQGQDEIAFPLYEYPYNSNTYCLGIGESDPPGSVNSFPSASEALSWQGESDPYRPSPIILSEGSSWQLNPAYPPYFRAREVIWGQTVRVGGSANVGEVLSAIRSLLIGSFYDGERGGMARAVPKNAIIFAGDVPRQNEIRFGQDSVTAQVMTEKIAEIREAAIQYDMNVTITFVILEHPYLSFGSEIEEFASFLVEQEGVGDSSTGGLRLQMLHGDDGEALAQKAASSLILEGRRVVLAE